MPRSKRSQSGHDRIVREEAKKLDSQGYHVDADVHGYERPKTLGGYRPDIIATKQRQRKIIEVETPDSVDSARDEGQRRAFRQAANRSKNTTFSRIVTSE